MKSAVGITLAFALFFQDTINAFSFGENGCFLDIKPNPPDAVKKPQTRSLLLSMSHSFNPATTTTTMPTPVQRSSNISQLIDAKTGQDGTDENCDQTATLVPGSSFDIVSPKHPRAYQHYSNCKWSLAVSASDRVLISCSDFVLGPDGGRTRRCWGEDHLQISGSGYFNNCRFCGRDLDNAHATLPVVNSTYMLQVTFVSNGFSSNGAFKCTVMSQGPNGTKVT